MTQFEFILAGAISTMVVHLVVDLSIKRTILIFLMLMGFFIIGVNEGRKDFMNFFLIEDMEGVRIMDSHELKGSLEFESIRLLGAYETQEEADAGFEAERKLREE